MKKFSMFFWVSLFLLVCFEVANVYFIMPMPGSQRMNSLNGAYFLYRWRWIFRVILGIGLVGGFLKARFTKKWIPVVILVAAGLLVYILNFQMAADKMFRKVQSFRMAPVAENKVDSKRLVIGVTIGNQARAYPIHLLGYHHFVEDSINGQPVLVTYCTVCRTGRVFSPVVDGQKQSFRLVGMDHFNAMIEDEKTGSWWRQATGEAVTGSQKGKRLTEIMSVQYTLAAWLKQNPHSLVMQPDPAFETFYPETYDYEDGSSRKSLTGTNPQSWQDKSWVVGIELNGSAMAFDWNALTKNYLVQTKLDGQPVLVLLAGDKKSFSAFRTFQSNTSVRLSGDTLWCGNYPFSFTGKALADTKDLEKIPAYQEFWHSWKTFHPQTGTWP